MTPEKKVQNDIRKLLKAYGYRTIRFEPNGEAGWPDLLCMGHGEVFFIEVKRHGAKPGPLQLKRISYLNEKMLIPAWWSDSALHTQQMLEARCLVPS